MKTMRVNRGRDALQECESRLRGLLAEAGAVGDYEAVLQFTEWARGVAALETVRPAAIGTGKNSNPTPHEEGHGTDRVSSSGRTTGNKSTRRKKRGVQHTQRKRKSIADEYPKFARFQEQLVKIGWSKKAKNEYRHKAPREVIDLLLDRLVQVGAPGHLFTTEDVFPLHGKGDSEVPSYQAYLALAWLKALGLVVQYGRQGYKLPTTTSIKPLIEREWDNLPT